MCPHGFDTKVSRFNVAIFLGSEIFVSTSEKKIIATLNLYFKVARYSVSIHVEYPVTR